MISFETITLEVADPASAEAFYEALGLAAHVRVRAPGEPAAVSGGSAGSGGFALSLVASQPGNVDALIGAALGAGATTLKPAAKTFWGYGGVVRAPDGTVCKVASSKKKDSAPAAPEFDQIALLLGVADVKASKRFYAGRGLAVAKSFGGKYAEFETSSAVTLALYPRRALAKDTGAAEEGAGSPRLVLAGGGAPFTDPDGFAWESAPVLDAGR
ncbi:glyoxalase [Actinomadura monticuli]|uniref:Glyoxalase n=1 Tax=Actinomadura monticuli TaxID=3097367 RepID=A0ABV4QHA3_9ACTN